MNGICNWLRFLWFLGSIPIFDPTHNVLVHEHFCYTDGFALTGWLNSHMFVLSDSIFQVVMTLVKLIYGRQLFTLVGVECTVTMIAFSKVSMGKAEPDSLSFSLHHFTVFAFNWETWFDDSGSWKFWLCDNFIYF